MSLIAQRLAEIGVVLPNPVAPVANYVPFVITGNLLVVSGQISLGPDGVIAGKLGSDMPLEAGHKAARICGLNVIAQIKAALGDLDRVARIVRLGGFINSTPHFYEGPKVMNGCSDLMVEVFGEAGRHARTTVGVASLPANAAVEVEALVEIKP